jgi:hypothetical protein
LARLPFIRDEWICLEVLDDLWVAREELVLELQHTRVRDDVTYAFEGSQREVGHWKLEREAFADQSVDVGAVFERVDARDHAARAVSE